MRDITRGSGGRAGEEELRLSFPRFAYVYYILFILQHFVALLCRREIELMTSVRIEAVLFPLGFRLLFISLKAGRFARVPVASLVQTSR